MLKTKIEHFKKTNQGPNLILIFNFSNLLCVSVSVYFYVQTVIRKGHKIRLRSDEWDIIMTSIMKKCCCKSSDDKVVIIF